MKTPFFTPSQYLLGLGQRMVHLEGAHHLAELFFINISTLVLVELLEEVDDLLEL